MLVFKKKKCVIFCFVCLILYVPSTIFQLNSDGSSWVGEVQARINVSAQGPQSSDASDARTRGASVSSQELNH